MDEQQELDALKAIDGATSQVATNITTIGATTQSIADAAKAIKVELEALLAKAQTTIGNVPQSIVDSITALQARMTTLSSSAQTATDALNAQVPALNAIASEGASNPVPVNPPPPLPPGA